MTKNIMVLMKLATEGEVSTNDFFTLANGNVRHMPRIINDARKYVEIYSETLRDHRTKECVGVKYILPIYEIKSLEELVKKKAKFQFERKLISKAENEFIQKGLASWS